MLAICIKYSGSINAMVEKCYYTIETAMGNSISIKPGYHEKQLTILKKEKELAL